MTPDNGPEAGPYDAFLLLSFGGPERPDDVVPFLENVTRGRGIPRERLVEVGEHYFSFGGRSPINDQNRAYLAAVTADLAAAGLDVPTYWGNRNWHPLLADTLREMARDGVERAAVLTTSAYSCYSSCRQYREDLAAAATEVRDELAAEGFTVPRLERLRQFFNHPGFVEPVVDATLAALDELPAETRTGARLVFVTHSIPDTMNDTSGPTGGAYVAQHTDVAGLVADRVAEVTGVAREHDLVYCSRSGPPQVPWLEPDVNDHLESLAGQGVPAVVMVPVGFVSDHMEVIYDLDTEALATAERLGLPAARAATPGVDPRFVAMARELLVERAGTERGETPVRPALGTIGAWPGVCAVGCCPNSRAPKPALCGEDA